MENRRLERSSELPDVIIQHIQSFLKPNEAAQTMLISKSWLRAWSTHPFLSFNFFSLSRKSAKRYHDIILTNVIDRTLKSYVEKGIPIVKFLLFVDVIQERWLKLARQCNVIELHLTARSNCTDSLFQEIFLTQSLQVLSIISHRFLLENTFRIKCVNLKKLQLCRLQISEATFQHLISSCPLIEDLLLANCNLIVVRNIGIQSSMFTGECASLKKLSLSYTEINDEQLQTILSKSPHLEDFNLIGCWKLVKPINLSSVSLKRVKIDKNNVQLVLLDASNLIKFKYNGGRLFRKIPFPITITSPITKSTVKVTIAYHDDYNIDESWFYGLREFLAKFAKSNVKFNLDHGFPLRIDFGVLRATSLPPWPHVQTLRFKRYHSLPLFYAFFTICHPKIVLLDHPVTMCKRKLLTKLLKDVSYKGNLDCCNFNGENKCWRHFIKDGKLDYLVDNVMKPLDMNGPKTGLGNQKLITLALEWESSD